MVNPQPTFLTIKNHISYHLEQMIQEVETMIKSIGEREYCLLCELGQIRERFDEIQSSASYFYLQAYISSYTSSYLELAKAIQNMSKQRHGALIAIEREDKVEPKLQGGVTINADLSNRLIESIFYPGNPLHDGAVYVKGEHILSAGNILPLTSKAFPKEKVGTRHRAAIGLSEISDALILVVSEETGKMSFALDGTLYPIVSSESNG
ncbi:sporulation-specific diadenylate cyclase CdaS [Bacillus weihaiensis]|uniref:sporulation-specific diadenylate cyclase CdaS n=1 Tax=Bacillus weihaiensis TaxID=1547283 RepID=UPI003F6D1497